MKRPVPLFLMVMLFTACSDIFETDISGAKITVISPSDEVQVAEGGVRFLWDRLEGAERYRVTVVTPDFANSAFAVKDTVIYQDSLSLSFGFRLRLEEGDYQWSIQSHNHSYQSVKSLYRLTVSKLQLPDEGEDTDPVQPEITER